VRRRDFLKAAGAAGLYVFIPGPAAAFGQEPAQIPKRLSGYPEDFNAYLRIGADGRVDCFVGKVEMGQGSMTSLAMVLAEELDVGLDRVRMVMGDTDLCPWDIGTFGSLSMWQFGPVLRAAGAEARAVLVQMAGERLGAAPESLTVADGTVRVKADPARQVTYAQLVQGRRIERHLKDAQPKPVAAHALVGSSAPRKDALEKVTGSARFAADLALPGTLHACVVRPPRHGAVLKAADTSAAERRPGVRVVRDGDLVAVLHEQPDQARAALGLVRAVFEGAGPAVDDRSIYRHLVAGAPEPPVALRQGDLKAGEARSVLVAEAEFLNAYVSHAPMETHGAVARWEDGRITVWAGIQAPFMVRAQVAQALGLPPQKVRIIAQYVGGAFGGKTMGPQAVEAARLARITGRPVQVVWDRREEFFLDTFRPAAVVKLRGGLGPDGRLAFWDHRVYGTSKAEADIGYAVPARQVLGIADFSGPAGLHPFATGAWRAPAANTNVFARESFMDILAAKAKVDPLAFRLAHLDNPRLAGVLRAGAERFGWTAAPAPSGRGVGVALGAWRDTLVATFARVAVDPGTGRVRVERVVQAQAMGLVVNPDGARQQMEGGITMGLGYALGEGLRFKDGRILDENFDTYAIPRFSGLPEIETVLVPEPDFPAQGGGEPPIVCMGAVLANAVFDAVGARVLELPMLPERILACS